MVYKIICLVPAPTTYGSDRKIAAFSPQAYECNVPSVVHFFFFAANIPGCLFKHSYPTREHHNMTSSHVGWRRLSQATVAKISFGRSKGCHPSFDERAKSPIGKNPEVNLLATAYDFVS